MAKILIVNPSKWGRGITPIWIPSHSAQLKARGHSVELFDATFYQDWTINEVKFNTENQQYKATKYFDYIQYNPNDIIADFQSAIDRFAPDIIIVSALSSHIHGEGEYVNIQYGDYLLGRVTTRAVTVAAGLQPTAMGETIGEKYPNIQYFIMGESEFVLADIADAMDAGAPFNALDGLIYVSDGQVKINKPQPIISDMDAIGVYDYSLFDTQVFYRPYNGDVVKAVDYELSRGCIYTCSYCVETVIQKYYGFAESSANGVLKNFKGYLRHKSAQRIFDELKILNEKFGVTLIRCQDTNFLTIDRDTLAELADLMDGSDLNVMLYIETRPETITRESIKLLRRLHVDGVGMGIEMSSEQFRQGSLHRFVSQDKIVDAFALLKENGIKRTAYNIIGLPNETEEMVLSTVEFNRTIAPDNMTVAFYSPYAGTYMQDPNRNSIAIDEFMDNVDGQLRFASNYSAMQTELLAFYKKNFNALVRNGLQDLDSMKQRDLVETKE